MTENTIVRAIFEVDEQDSAKLTKIAKTLNCSNTRALQIALHEAFGIASYEGKSKKAHFSFREDLTDVGKIFIPLTIEQREHKERVEKERRATFAFLCSQAIDIVHLEVEKLANQKDNEVISKYLRQTEHNNIRETT